MTRRRGAGFTLMEMVVSIVLLGIVGTTIGAFMIPAINAHRDVERRAALVDATESALRRMSRDIRLALPNSVRITNLGNGFAIEMIPTVDGARYCTSGIANCAGAAQLLDFSGSDTDFDILGCFRNATFTGSPGSGYRLVIGDASGLVYSASGSPAVMTPSATTISLTTVTGGGATPGACGTSSGANTSNRHHVTLSAGHQFSTASSRQRVFVVQMPATYICNFSTGTLTRYAGYAIQASQPTDGSSAPLSTAPAIGRVTGDVSACSITTTTADVQSRSVLTLILALTSSGESVQLLSQVQVDNSQ